MYTSNLGYKGYLGITASNNKEATTKVELTTAKIYNKSPSHIAALSEEELDNNVYVDEMVEDAIDLIEAKRLVQDRETEY